ncbi:hypothetical protein S245_019291 [Arachis hypogaea]|nr:uncharacterized protein DS421_6g175770 [Arachis hypogaea]
MVQKKIKKRKARCALALQSLPLQNQQHTLEGEEKRREEKRREGEAKTKKNPRKVKDKKGLAEADRDRERKNTERQKGAHFSTTPFQWDSSPLLLFFLRL